MKNRPLPTPFAACPGFEMLPSGFTEMPPAPVAPTNIVIIKNRKRVR